jgi:hypothetical protein
LFGDGETERREWHRREAEAAEGTLDWSAAAFHWEQLHTLEPDNAESAQRRDYALRCLTRAKGTARTFYEQRRVIPPRDPRAGGRLLDLTDHYTGFVEEGVPTGLQTLGGVQFDVRGEIALFGQGPEARGFRRPEKVAGIRVQQRFGRLHFLHTAGWANTPDGEEMATVVVEYVNGQVEKIPIQNRVHVADHWSTAQLAPAQAEVVWIGTYPFANSFQKSAWLYKYTWPNPHPDWEISRIDLVSTKTKASYTLVALTVE